jgi:hypothetical protein
MNHKTNRPGKRLAKAEIDRRDIFCIEYASNGGNGTQAYLSAGYKQTPNARQSASRLLTIPHIQNRIRLIREEMHDDLVMTKKEVIRETSLLASFDPRRLLDEDGNMKHLRDMDDATAKSVQELELLVDEDGNTTGKVKFGKEKRAAIDMMNRHYNNYEDRYVGQANFTVIHIHPADKSL